MTGVFVFSVLSPFQLVCWLFQGISSKESFIAGLPPGIARSVFVWKERFDWRSGVELLLSQLYFLGISIYFHEFPSLLCCVSLLPLFALPSTQPTEDREHVRERRAKKKAQGLASGGLGGQLPLRRGQWGSGGKASKSWKVSFWVFCKTKALGKPQGLMVCFSLV